MESFILHTNQYTRAFKRSALIFPFSGLRAFRSNRYLFYNEVFIHTQFKSDKTKFQ